MLSLDGRWIDFQVRRFSTGRGLDLTGGQFAGGMSGSPIITLDGAALGVVCNSVEARPFLQPCILDCLPPRLGLSGANRGGTARVLTVHAPPTHLRPSVV